MTNVSGNNTLQIFKNLVGIKFQLYNSLFTSLPFYKVEKTGVLLSLFILHCEDGFSKEMSPTEIIEGFLKQYTHLATEQEQVELLFRFVQYAERQVVLFDALEDAAFKHINDINGSGTIKHLQSEVEQTQTHEQLSKRLKDFAIRLVLTAHPTQFYPSEVLGIINDLSKAIINDNTALVNSYLQQLGKTPFFKKTKPTPYDEAISLIWFLENIFYNSAGNIVSYIKSQFPDALNQAGSPIIKMGFWPGGDRDGNPFVKSDTTLKVAEALRGAIIKSYYLDVRRLRRRLTFKGVENYLADLETKLYNNLFVPGHKADINKDDILNTLISVRKIVIDQHNGLFLHLIENFISKVQLFGMYFASLDVRQDSSIHEQVIEQIVQKSNLLPKDYYTLNSDNKIKALLEVTDQIDTGIFDNELHKDTILTMGAIKEIQKINGEAGCHRYIISHSTSALNIIEVYSLMLMSGWHKNSLTIDIVPLFETIDDLAEAGEIMKSLYKEPSYRKHIQNRGNIQTIMLGFSDGTKDGGYLTANWSIYKAKEELTLISKEYGVQVIFFDGRGGPPARGGGKTHQFYASMGGNIANKEIQLTIQGQTISSNFGTTDVAQYNMEQLMHAGISNNLFSHRETTMSKEEDELIQLLSDESYKAFGVLKNNPNFLEYLSFASPLRYYAETNIGSRPAKRSTTTKLTLSDLRAVPYVGAWSQLKQNLPGYYGVGAAFEKLESMGRWKDVKQLYDNSLFFRTLMGNCEMAMKKCFFPLTAYLSKNPQYGDLWLNIHEEFEKTKKYMLRLTGGTDLMSDKPVEQLSINMRHRIELPLLTIQQHALTKIRESDSNNGSNALKPIYEKLVMRCSFGIINAERNSA
jgi:phosphoenolpyruvate carboxylase